MASLELNFDEYYADADGTYNASCYQYRENKEYQIIKDFLQPDGPTCLQRAADSLLENCSPGAIVSILHLCANVIPWHHNSHLKLAYLAERLRWSKKMSPNLDTIKVTTIPPLERTCTMLALTTLEKTASDSYMIMACFSDALWEDYDSAGT